MVSWTVLWLCSRAQMRDDVLVKLLVKHSLEVHRTLTVPVTMGEYISLIFANCPEMR